MPAYVCLNIYVYCVCVYVRIHTRTHNTHIYILCTYVHMCIRFNVLCLESVASLSRIASLLVSLQLQARRHIAILAIRSEIGTRDDFSTNRCN